MISASEGETSQVEATTTQNFQKLQATGATIIFADARLRAPPPSCAFVCGRFLQSLEPLLVSFSFLFFFVFFGFCEEPLLVSSVSLSLC